MWAKRAKNALAMLAIGDGVMQIVAPQEHEHLWMVGPAWLSKAKGIGWLRTLVSRACLEQRR